MVSYSAVLKETKVLYAVLYMYMYMDILCKFENIFYVSVELEIPGKV